jgi:hypothetical protein
LEGAFRLQPWHPDVRLALARMELEPVSATAVFFRFWPFLAVSVPGSPKGVESADAWRGGRRR